MSPERCTTCPKNSSAAGLLRAAGVVRQQQPEQAGGCPGPRIIETLQKKVLLSTPVVIHRRETCSQEVLRDQLRTDEKPETATTSIGADGRETVQVMARFFFAKLSRY